MSKIIQIKNSHITSYPILIGKLKIDEKQSSARRRFLRDLRAFQSDLDDARKELQMKYGTKDDKGELKTNADNTVKYAPDKAKALEKEWNALNDEVITIDVTPANDRDIAVMTAIIANEQKRFILDKKNTFTADDFEYTATLEELAEMLQVFEAKPIKKNGK